MSNSSFSYAGNILRVDLSSDLISKEEFKEEDRRKWIGGAGLGAKILWEEVPSHVKWDDPENRLIFATGPLAGLPVWGTGGLTVVTRGAMTNGSTNTLANGFFGANIKYCGYDAVIFQGQSKDWVYLHIHEDGVDIKSAEDLLGKDTWETQETLEKKLNLNGHNLSVYSIGPAGENLVRFAAIQGDYGHVASKNGCGAVMGKKKIKAVVIERGKKGIKVGPKIPPLGAMIETPAAAMSADHLSGVCDFFAIGTNDLTMYTLAIDRGDDQVAQMYNAILPY